MITRVTPKKFLDSNGISEIDWKLNDNDLRFISEIEKDFDEAINKFENIQIKNTY